MILAYYKLLTFEGICKGVLNKPLKWMDALWLKGRFLLCIRERKYPEPSGRVQERKKKRQPEQWPRPGKWAEKKTMGVIKRTSSCGEGAGLGV